MLQLAGRIDHGPQCILAIDHLLQRRLQRAMIHMTRQAQSHMDVVGQRRLGV